MALVDDDDAFEAALSFLDEYSFEEAKTEDLHPSDDQNEPAPELHDVSDSSDGHAPPIQSTGNRFKTAGQPNADQVRRRKEFNERRKMLRRTGVYSDPNRSRKERKKEIGFLRERMQKLQLDLQAVRSKAAEHSRQQEMLPGERAGDMALIPKVWREIAARQRHRREDSESENIRLRLVVEQQQKVVDSLRRLLQKRAAHVIWCRLVVYLLVAQRLDQRHNIDRALDFRGDVGDFQALFRHLDAARLGLDTMLVANGLTDMTISPIDVHVREDIKGKYMEFFTFKELPFGVQDTMEVAWDHWRGTEKHIMGNGGLYQKAAKDLDQPYTIVEDFTKELFSNTARADVQVKQVIRRYVEAERDIIIWVARLTPTEIKHKLLRGLTYNLRGQVVIKQSRHSTSEQEVAVLQQCSLIYLDQEARLRYDPSSLRALTHFLTIHAAQNQRAHREMIENTLLDRAQYM